MTKPVKILIRVKKTESYVFHDFASVKNAHEPRISDVYEDEHERLFNDPNCLTEYELGSASFREALAYAISYCESTDGADWLIMNAKHADATLLQLQRDFEEAERLFELADNDPSPVSCYGFAKRMLDDTRQKLAEYKAKAGA